MTVIIPPGAVRRDAVRTATSAHRFPYDRPVPAPTPELLARLPLFQRVRPEDRVRIAAASRVQHVERGDEIFQEGESPETFVTVIAGRVKIYKRLASGRDLILHICGVGDPLGAVAVFENRPYPASAQAIESASCLLVPRQTFFGLLEQSPSLVRGILSGLTLRMIELTDRLTELTGAQVETRFAKLFLKLADQFGRDHPNGRWVPLALSRQELADLTGTTIETCIRVMSRWGKEHVLVTEKDGFLLVERRALEQLAAG
jgi:CRP-like cAMP-binding protein